MGASVWGQPVALEKALGTVCPHCLPETPTFPSFVLPVGTASQAHLPVPNPTPVNASMSRESLRMCMTVIPLTQGTPLACNCRAPSTCPGLRRHLKGINGHVSQRETCGLPVQRFLLPGDTGSFTRLAGILQGAVTMGHLHPGSAGHGTAMAGIEALLSFLALKANEKTGGASIGGLRVDTRTAGQMSPSLCGHPDSSPATSVHERPYRPHAAGKETEAQRWLGTWQDHAACTWWGGEGPVSV